MGLNFVEVLKRADEDFEEAGYMRRGVWPKGVWIDITEWYMIIDGVSMQLDWTPAPEDIVATDWVFESDEV